MASNNNANVLRRFLELVKGNVADGLPNQISNVISPVLMINPRPEIQIAVKDASDTTSSTIFTTHATKRTFVIGATLTINKDVNNDGGSSKITCVPKGKSANTDIVKINYEPLTASSNLTSSITFDCTPIELEKGSLVRIVNATATASIDSGAIVFYYEEEEN